MPIKVEQCCANRKSGFSIINETLKTTVLPLKSQLSSPSFPLNQIIHAPLYCTVIMVQGVGLQHSKLLSTDYHWPNGEFQLYSYTIKTHPNTSTAFIRLEQTASQYHTHSHTFTHTPFMSFQKQFWRGKKYQTCRLCDCFSLRVSLCLSSAERANLFQIQIKGSVSVFCCIHLRFCLCVYMFKQECAHPDHFQPTSPHPADHAKQHIF